MNPADPQTLLKGLNLLQQARTQHAGKALAAAADSYRQALALLPTHPQLLSGYAQLASEVGDWPSAEKLWRRLQKLSTHPGIDGKIAEALHHQQRYTEALPFFSSFLAQNTADAEALRLCANCCFRALHFDDASRHAEAAWKLVANPDTLHLLIAIRLECGDDHGAAPLVEEALARFPEHAELRKLAAEFLLKSGDFRRGLAMRGAMRVSGRESEAGAGLDVPGWDGTPFAGTLLVSAEQGLGDEILMSSLYGDLVRVGQPAMIEADARLLGVLARSFPQLEFVPRDTPALRERAAAGGELRKITAAGLGLYFRSEPGWQLPAGGWLRADPARTAQCRTRNETLRPRRLHAGLSWKSRRVMNSGARKDIPLAVFAPLLALPDLDCLSLQYDDIAADLATLPAAGQLRIDPYLDPLNDIEGLFAAVAALDWVITISNVTAHVAGALGKRCLVLLPMHRPVIWYWGFRGTTTPFYPSLKLLRSTDDADWSSLVARVAAELQVRL